MIIYIILIFFFKIKKYAAYIRLEGRSWVEKMEYGGSTGTTYDS